MRPWRRRSHDGAHQLASPATRMNVGTSTLRTSVASIRMAKAAPKPSCLMFVTPLDRKAANTMAISSAAAVMMRPVRCRPKATESTVSCPVSCSSLMRESRKSS